MEEIWGLPFGVFVAFYAMAGVALLTAGLVVRRSARQGRPPSRDLHPYEIAYLDGGGRHAIATSLMAMRLDGAVDAYASGQVQATGRLRHANKPLDRTIHRALRGRVPTVANITTDPNVRMALDQLRDGLAAQGAVMDAKARTMARFVMWPARIWGILGLFIGVISDEQPTPGRFACAILGIVLFAAAGAGGGKQRTKAGEAVLDDLRTRNGHLDPDLRPVYQGVEAPLAVALFGTGALMIVDPMFAQTLGLGRYLALAGSASSGSTGSSGSSYACSSSASVCSSGGCGGGGSCGGGGGGGCGGGGGGGCGGGGGGCGGGGS